MANTVHMCTTYKYYFVNPFLRICYTNVCSDNVIGQKTRQNKYQVKQKHSVSHIFVMNNNEGLICTCLYFSGCL